MNGHQRRTLVLNEPRADDTFGWDPSVRSVLCVSRTGASCARSLSTPAVTRHGGIIHQLLGDGLMAIFGAPLATPNDCTHAVDAALDIVAEVEAAIDAGQLAPLGVGIGLYAGEVVAGTVGSPQHKEYKVTGDVVNVASRVEGLNKVHGSRILVSNAVWARVPKGRHPAESLGHVELSGRRDGLELFCLA